VNFNQSNNHRVARPSSRRSPCRQSSKVLRVQQWEQWRAVPDRPARILLRVIETDPQAVGHALAAGTGRN
jgi:hypothetical protein